MSRIYSQREEVSQFTIFARRVNHLLCKAWHGRQEFASHFFTGSQNTLTQRERWSTYFCFSWLEEKQAAQYVGNHLNIQKQHRNRNLFCILLSFVLYQKYSTYHWGFFTFGQPLVSSNQLALYKEINID